MGAEPSALGPRLRFNRSRVPDVEAIPFPMERLDELTLPDPRTDGFMALCLHRYEKLKQRIVGEGFMVPVVAVRGPLTRQRMLSLSIDCPPVYGDPALLVPLVHPRRSETTRRKLGIVPHYKDASLPAVAALAGHFRSSVVIDVLP